MEPILEPHIKNSPLIFWKPPLTYLIPVPPPGHTYIPLQQLTFSVMYPNHLALHHDLAQRLTPGAFNSLIMIANTTVKTPFFKYTFIRCLLFLLLFVWILNFFISIATVNITGIFIYLILIILNPFLMRLGGSQYCERMRKYEAVMRKTIANGMSAVLAGTGVTLEPGSRCFWLDFYTGESRPEVPEAVYAPPVYAQPVYAQPIYAQPVYVAPVYVGNSVN